MDNDLAKIWDQFREGDERSFSVLFEMYLQPLHRYGMKFVSDEAFVKDCIQDLFIKLYNNRASLSATANPKLGIPRFILVGKDGEIISSDAPQPSSSKIRPLLESLLK